MTEYLEAQAKTVLLFCHAISRGKHTFMCGHFGDNRQTEVSLGDVLLPGFRMVSDYVSARNYCAICGIRMDCQ